MATLYRCEMCSHNRVPFVALSIALIVNHYGRYHRHDPDFYVTCKIDGCSASSKAFEGYRTHLRRHHKEVDLSVEQLQGNESVPNANENTTEIEREHLDFQQNPLRDIDNEDNPRPSLSSDFQKQNALFLLKTKEIHQLTQKATDSVVSDTTCIVQNAVEQIKGRVDNCLESAGIKLHDIPGLEDIFRTDSHECNPFHGIRSKTEQQRYFRENFGLVDPERHILGHNHTQFRSGVHHKRIRKFDEMVVVSLLKTLEAMLHEPSILYEIEHPHENGFPNGRIYDFCDGEAFRSHPLFSRDKSALQIILYYDEVECVNPLGSKTKKHKIGVFYYTLGNIRPAHRSQLKAIQLLVIVRRPLVNKYGINAILAPIMEEILQLEQDGGYQFTIRGEKRSFAGTIAFVSGDNLASQELGGFKVGPGSHLKCRECMGATQELKTKFREDHFILRTAQSYDDQCDEIEEDPTLSRSYGVNFMSALCQSRYFHVIGGLPGDAMHDVLEGCLQYELKELLKYAIQEQKYFTLQHLNSCLQNFDFGYQNDKNKPSVISDGTINSDSNTLHQKASQMWCLARFLPMIVGAKVPENDEKWQLYLKMLDITDIIFSPATSASQAANLALLIEEHHKEFSVLYPNCSIIPKMHYIIHYPNAMIRLGPMMTHWCMRFEAKHQYFKQLATALGNFTNLPWTLAHRHQNRQCYNMYNIHKPIECGAGKQHEAGTRSYFELLKESDVNTNVHSLVNEQSWVTKMGTKYKVGAVVQVGYLHFLPVFAIIKKIVVVNGELNKLYFILESLDTIEYHEHYHAYKVEKPIDENITICNQEELTLFLPMHYTNPVNANGSYVNIKFDVDLLNLV